MSLRNTIISLILTVAGLAPASGQYFTSLGISLDVRASANIPLVVADPNEPGFSGQLLAGKFPGRNIPADPIRLIYPVISGAIDTAAILWYLRPEEITAVPGELNVIVVAIKPDNEKRFFIDGNNDRVFSTSEYSFVFRKNEKSKAVNIMVDGTYYPYTLMNPDYVPPAAPSETIGSSKKKWDSGSKKPSLALDLSASFFSGRTYLSYYKLSRPENRISYLADIPGSFRPALGLDFSWYRIHLIVYGGYEVSEYTNNVMVSAEGDYHYTNYNRGTWPDSRLFATLSLEYDISTGRYLYLSPYCSFSVLNNDEKYPLESRLEAPEGAEYTDGHATECGVKLKLPAAPTVMIYVSISYSTIYYNAETYFHDITPGSYSMHQQGFYYGVGVNFRFNQLEN